MDALLLCFLSLLLAVDMTSGGLMFRYGLSHGDTEYSSSQRCQDAVPLSTTYRFYGNGYDEIYVCVSGYVAFDWGIELSSPFDEGLEFFGNVIAPYLSYVKLIPGSDAHIWYRETSDRRQLEKARKIIQRHFGAECGRDFVPTSLFIVTWDNVMSYCDDYCPQDAEYYEYCWEDIMYSHHPPMYLDTMYYDTKKRDTGLNPELEQESEPEGEESIRGKDSWWHGTNQFQLVLATDGYDTFTIFNIKKIDWMFCLGHNRMTISHDDSYFGYANIHLPTTDLVTSSNVKKAGRWAFKISEPSIQQPNCTSAEFDARLINYY